MAPRDIRLALDFGRASGAVPLPNQSRTFDLSSSELDWPRGKEMFVQNRLFVKLRSGRAGIPGDYGITAKALLNTNGIRLRLKLRHSRPPHILSSKQRQLRVARQATTDGPGFLDIPRCVVGFLLQRRGEGSPSIRLAIDTRRDRLHCRTLSGPKASRKGGQLVKVADILRGKGRNVITVPPTATLLTLVHRLKLERIGAVIVSRDRKTIDGIVSERDVAWGLAEHGADLLNRTVADVMTKSVLSCSPDDTITSIARIMTERRLRHLPVQLNGELVGVVSIGDVVKHRLDEMQLEANVLRDYATARR